MAPDISEIIAKYEFVLKIPSDKPFWLSTHRERLQNGHLLSNMEQLSTTRTKTTLEPHFVRYVVR